MVFTKMISKKQTKNGQNTQTNIQINNGNKYLSNTQIKLLSKGILNKKRENQKLMIKALTPLGWLTYLSYGDKIDNFENFDYYLNGRITNTSIFNNDISQLNVIIMESN